MKLKKEEKYLQKLSIYMKKAIMIFRFKTKQRNSSK